MNMPKQFSKKWKTVREQALAALVAWAIVFVPAAAAAQEKSQPQKASTTTQSPPKSESKTPTETPGSAAKSERPGGPQEGIKVHGHWVIEVRNPDGSLASHTEFENALVPIAGAGALVQLLNRSATFGYFEVVVGDANKANGPCLNTDPRDPTAPGHAFNCHIVEPIGTSPFSDCSSKWFTCNLQLTTQTSLKGEPQLQLKGFSAPVDHAAAITLVSTGIILCEPTLAPAAGCKNANSFLGGDFTAATISPISVVKDQVMTVTVTLSFSSGAPV
jgi:hypothetical protein